AEQQIGHAEVAQDRGDEGGGGANEPACDECHGANSEAGEGADDGDLELDIRGLWLLLQIGDATADEERDALDSHAARAGHERVRKLMEQDGDEEQQRGDEAKHPINERGLSGHGGGEPTHRERERQQDQDNEPANVDLDVNASNSADPK